MSQRLIVAGGGTGGHVLAGVAIADAWKAAQPEAEVLFVGARGGIEEKLVARSGYPLSLLNLGALKGVSRLKRLKTLLQLPLSFLVCLKILLQFRPHAVIGVGGYASGPLVLLAGVLGRLWGAKVGILEQNAVPGFTNRVLGRFAHFVLSAFPGVDGYFPRGKVRVCGNPVRSIMQPMPPASREPFTLFVFGGSQGAIGINTLVLEAIPHLGDLAGKIRWIHQTGEKDFERVRAAHEKLGTGARVEKFIYDMADCYQQSSLLICRAGSSTLSEVAAVGRAAILIPFPQASDNHQFKNAQLFVQRGAARLLPQLTSRGEDLARQIRDLLENPQGLGQMEQAVREFYRPRSAQDVVSFLSRS